MRLYELAIEWNSADAKSPKWMIKYLLWVVQGQNPEPLNIGMHGFIYGEQLLSQLLCSLKYVVW